METLSKPFSGSIPLNLENLCSPTSRHSVKQGKTKYIQNISLVTSPVFKIKNQICDYIIKFSDITVTVKFFEIVSKRHLSMIPFQAFSTEKKKNSYPKSIVL